MSWLADTRASLAVQTVMKFTHAANNSTCVSLHGVMTGVKMFHSGSSKNNNLRRSLPLVAERRVAMSRFMASQDPGNSSFSRMDSIRIE